MGVSRSAQTTDATSVAVTMPPSCPSMMPVTPFTNTRGTNTTIVVRVEARIAVPTSSAPFREASSRDAPRDACERMFSSTTTALSTTMPTARASAERLIRFTVQPLKNMNTEAATSEKGIVSEMTSDVRKLRRKKSVTSTTNSPPHATVRPTDWIDLPIESLVSNTTSIA